MRASHFVTLGACVATLAGTTNALAASVIPDDINPIADTFLDIGDKYSNAKDAFELTDKLGALLGFWSANDPSAPFTQLSNEIQQAAYANDWHATLIFLAQQRGSALWAIQSLARQGTVAEGSNEDQSSGTAVATLINNGAAFLRANNPAETAGLWTDYVPDRPTVTNGLVYDWRLGAPALLELVGYRLAVIAAMDPNFRWNTRWHNELKFLRQGLLTQYQTMLGGIHCGEHYTFGRALGLGDVCADIYTGNFVVYPQTPPEPPSSITFPRLISQLTQKMPLFEMKAMIDTLSFYIDGIQDLSEVNGDVRLLSGSQLCLDSVSESLDVMTPMQIAPCNFGNSQWWVYDRQSTNIVNQNTGWCLDVTNGDAIPDTPVWSYWCTGNNAQRWTWDPDSHVLQNAIGNVLAFTGINGNSIRTEPINTGTQQWVAPQACTSVCSASSGPMPAGCGGECGAFLSALDPYCSTTQWDSVCVEEVTDFCGLKC